MMPRDELQTKNQQTHHGLGRYGLIVVLVIIKCQGLDDGVYKVVDFRPQLHAQEIFSIELFQTV
jgi:hypothetical protein